MNKRITMILAGLLLMGLMGNAAMGAAVTLPDSTGQMDLTANVSQQISITSLPSSLTFNVLDIAESTTATGVDAQVVITDIVLADGGKLQLQLSPLAGTFVRATGGASVAWPCSAVSWTTGTWTESTGTATALEYTAEVPEVPEVPAIIGTGTEQAPEFPLVPAVPAVPGFGVPATFATSTAANASKMTSEALSFTLAAPADGVITKTGNYTLSATWILSAI